MTAAALDAAYAECARIVRASGSSFHQAFRLLPRSRRRSLEALYAYCRVVDDAADGGGDAGAAVAFWRQELARVLAGTPTHPVGIALADSMEKFAIPARHLQEILDGVAMDLAPQRFPTFADLRRYCYLVAAAVGLATIPIFGCRDPRSRDYAESLGVALQLTNILRDLAEDAERGRVYLPQEDLVRFGYGERDLATHVGNDAFRALVAFECARAADFYAAARRALTAVDRRALAPAEGMRLVYSRVLAKIAARPEAAFGPQVRLPGWQKVMLAGYAWLRTRLPCSAASLAAHQGSPA
ncbi:MAG: squalene synthase HpnD [Polyangiaceae bacterium UTPRO1]|jgi:phytoene synthase|nr:presqualene diphosphate synthase HpnD [Myxococcales bacterium]OQY66818.1 MAG: squalene synthase HpnD [Polyangiaceae bacterium UTPRO1]